MRSQEIRTATIRFDDGELEDVTGASLVVRTNIPMKWLEVVDDKNLTSINDFLSQVTVSWEGFDLPLERASFGELTMLQTRGIMNRVLQTIQNPPKATSAASL